MHMLERMVQTLGGNTALKELDDRLAQVSGESPEDVINRKDLTNLHLMHGKLVPLTESDGPSSIYAGSTAWQTIFSEFPDLGRVNQELGDKYRHTPERRVSNNNTTSSMSPDVASRFTSLNFPFDNTPTLSPDELLTLLPSTQLTRLLINKFFSSLLPFNQIVHPAKFRSEYDQFLSAPSRVKPEWIALLFSVLLSATTSYSPQMFTSLSNSEMTHSQACLRFFFGAKATLVLARFLRNHSLPIIQTLILIQMGSVPDDLTGISISVNFRSQYQSILGHCMEQRKT